MLGVGLYVSILAPFSWLAMTGPGTRLGRVFTRPPSQVIAPWFTKRRFWMRRSVGMPSGAEITGPPTGAGTSVLSSRASASQALMPPLR